MLQTVEPQRACGLRGHGSCVWGCQGKTPDFLNPDATKPIAELHRAEGIRQKWQGTHSRRTRAVMLASGLSVTPSDSGVLSLLLTLLSHAYARSPIHPPVALQRRPWTRRRRGWS